MMNGFSGDNPEMLLFSREYQQRHMITIDLAVTVLFCSTSCYGYLAELVYSPRWQEGNNSVIQGRKRSYYYTKSGNLSENAPLP